MRTAKEQDNVIRTAKEQYTPLVVIFDYHGKENWHVSDPHNLFQKSSNMINCLKYEYSVFFNSVKKHQKHLINWLATHVPFPIFGWSLTCHCIISLALN